ncbi:MAG: hypothetical protein H7Z42_11400 [Roseiflexaceae bacterium]|nr:hypothetical protein [Roseiflexaceae bacterium]
MSTFDPPQTPPGYPPATGFTQPVGAQPTADGDRWGLIAITVVVMSLLSCVPGLNCLLPFAPLVAGLIALNKAKDAVNPQQVRTYGWIATILGILFLLAIVAVVVLYGAIFASAFGELQSNPDIFTTP